MSPLMILPLILAMVAIATERTGLLLLALGLYIWLVISARNRTAARGQGAALLPDAPAADPVVAPPLAFATSTSTGAGCGCA